MNSLSGVNALGPVDDPVDARVGHRRDAPDRAFHDRLEALHVGRQELAVEVGRDAVERPRRRVALVAAHAQPADLLAEVDEVVRVAQLGQARVDALDRLGEEVLVGHRDDRHGHADQPADLRREHPAGVDDDVGADLGAFALVLDGHAGHAAALRADRDDPGLRSGSGAPRCRAPAASALASPDGSSQPSVGSQTAPRTPSVDISGKRSWASRAVMSSSGRPNVLAQPACRRSSSNRSGLDARRSEPTSCHDGSVPVSAASRRYRSDAVHHHLGEGHRAAQLADQAGRVEGRSGGQLRPIDEDDVGPAALGEVVGDATSRRRRRR